MSSLLKMAGKNEVICSWLTQVEDLILAGNKQSEDLMSVGAYTRRKVDCRYVIRSNICHSNSERQRFVCVIRLAGWRIIQHPQGCYCTFELKSLLDRFPQADDIKKSPITINQMKFEPGSRDWEVNVLPTRPRMLIMVVILTMFRPAFFILNNLFAISTWTLCSC